MQPAAVGEGVVGCDVGTLVGAKDGVFVGSIDGEAVGVPEGTAVGREVGEEEGPGDPKWILGTWTSCVKRAPKRAVRPWSRAAETRASSMSDESTVERVSLRSADNSPGLDTVKVAVTLLLETPSSRRRFLRMRRRLTESAKNTDMDFSSTPETPEKAVMKTSSSLSASVAFMPEKVISIETDAEMLGDMVGVEVGVELGTLEGIGVGVELDGAKVGFGELKVTTGDETLAVVVAAKRVVAP